MPEFSALVLKAEMRCMITHTHIKEIFFLWELAHMIMEAEKSVCCLEPENQESLWYNSVPTSKV